MPTATTDLIARFARVFLVERPSAANMSNYVSRVDSGSITLAQQLNEFRGSGDRVQGAADELTALFFIMLGRAPDYPTYASAMNLLESGSGLLDIADLAMNLRGVKLNLTQSNTVFVDRLAEQMFDQPQFISGLAALKTTLTQQLEAGVLTRASLLVGAASYQHPQIKFRTDIDTALISMAAGGREATSAEIELYSGVNSMHIIREMLTAAGELPYGNRPYFLVETNANNDPQLTITGTIIGTFSINLQTKICLIAGASNFQLVYSPDAGVSESIVRYRPSLISSFDTLDCSELITTTLTSITVTAPNTHFEYIGANKPNTVYAGRGNDSLNGGSDADTFYAAAGQDTLTGGAGIDTFVFAPAATYRASTDNLTEITDFGYGADKISFNRLFGKTTSAAAVTPIQVDAAPTAAQVTLLNAISSNGVVLIRNSGDWVDEEGYLTSATAENIATTFEDVVLTDTTTISKLYTIITYDIENGADIWLVSNFTGLTTIVEAEIRLIGHINGYENTDLLTQLQTSGSILV